MEGIELENSQSNFVRMIKEICEEEGISCVSYSSDWAFQLEKNGKKRYNEKTLIVATCRHVLL